MASRYRFTSEPADALKCLICLDVAEDPWHHVKCRKLFCKKCLEAYGKSNPCPNCRAKKPKYLEDIKSKSSLVVVSKL